MRLALFSLVPVALAAAFLAQPVYAHGIGDRTELPVPLGYFLAGAGVAVAFSFAVIGLFFRGGSASASYWRYDLFQHRALRLVLAGPVLLPFKLLSVFLLGLVVVAGLAGDQTPTLNFAPVFVWIIWWVGMAFLAALVGNLWAVLNPWKALFEFAEALYRLFRPGRSLSLNVSYPTAWGIWPAVALFLCFSWLQDAFPQNSLPDRVAVMAIVYTVITLGGMAVFGKHCWLRHGEAFSVVFGFFAKFAPTESRVTNPALCQACGSHCLGQDGDCVNCYECFEKAEDRELNVRPLAIGLSRKDGITNDALAMVVLLLATVTFDGFSATSAWVDFQSYVVDAFSGAINYAAFNSLTLADTIGVLLFPAAFLFVFLLFCSFMSLAAEQGLGAPEMARAFALSLIPIALAYNIAHFITLLLVQGQLIVPVASDPLGRGWDLFGTADYQIAIGIINARIVWFLSVAVIVAGHVLAVYLAHLAAFRLFKDRTTALNSQYPMLTLMVLYTVVSLWIIAQPIVE